MALMDIWRELISFGFIVVGTATFFYKSKKDSDKLGLDDVPDDNSVFEENERLKLIFLNVQKDAKIGTWEWNPITKEIIWSDEMYSIFETDRGVKPTLSFIKSMLYEDDIIDYDLGIKKMLDGSFSKKTKFRIVTSNGKTKHLKVKAKLFKDLSDNHSIKILGTAQDVSKETQITDFLSKTKNNYRLLTEALPVGIYRTNAQGELLFMNQTMVEMFGFDSMVEMKRYNCSELYYHESDRQVMLDDLMEQGTLEDYRILCKRKDGGMFVVTQNSQIQNDEIHGVLQDVTTRSRVENEKNVLIDTLKRQNKDYETFAHIISHNLRIPLVNIMGLTEIFDVKSMNRDNKELLELMRLSTKNLDMIIKDLNKTISIREKKHEHYKIMGLSKVLEEVKGDLADLINSTDTIITTNITSEDYIFSIPEFINNILFQIIDNAIKFRSPKRPSKIHIEFNQSDLSNVLTIEDQGIGIDMAQNSDRLFKLYERFYPELGGRGVGLYLTYNHVNALKGEVSIISKVDKGTKITLDLPSGES